MAHMTAPSGHCLRYAPTEGRLQLPHQLTSLRSPLLVQRPAIRRQHKSARVSAVAVPLPPAQPENPARRLRRSSSEQLGKAVRLLRSLSSKFASAPEATVQQVSPAQLKGELLRADSNIVVLMCKAQSCRPCKMFARKYQRIAADYASKGAIFLEILGDETSESRKLMIEMAIKVTPTFCIFHDKEIIRRVTGISEDNLKAAIAEELSNVESAP
ncbi:g7257 [Coccomyxa viridis]|uniref:G7257 protein n=1 Tax=Coccomyxa viridis TaxID=1274662 RepID=A0ABP1FXE2_9CHLO